MRYILISILLLLLSCGQAFAVSQFTAESLQSELEKAINSFNIPGAVLIVENDSGDKWIGTAGLAEYPNTPMTADLNLYIASITKTMTATITLQLVDEGKISLETPLETVLPGVIVNSSNVTIRNLLEMRSGLGNYGQNAAFIEEVEKDFLRKWTPKELISYSNSTYADPGTVYDYNNANYILLGMIIEKLTGMTYAENIQSRIAVPLGLDRTYLLESPHIKYPHAHGYLNEEGSLIDETEMADPSMAWSAGAVTSTCGQLITWIKALVAGDLISAQMHKEQMNFKPTSDPDQKYGLGVLDMQNSIGHSGDYNNYYNSWAGKYNGWHYAVLCNGQTSKGGAQSNALLVFLWVRDHVRLPQFPVSSFIPTLLSP